jgi:transcriptional regulator with XRE-family HTH domain
MSDKNEDSAMAKVRRYFEQSGLSLHDLGLRMGYEPEMARQSAWQFMKSADPRTSMLEKFAFAIGVPMNELLNPVRQGLRLIMTPLTELKPMRDHAKKKTNVEEMRECVDRVYERCDLYQKCCPEYFPETVRLAPYFQSLEECRSMPRATESDRKAFISKADECLSRLHTEIKKLL